MGMSARARDPKELRRADAALAIPDGYRQSEVGLIPREWKVVNLSDLLSFRNGVNADKSAYGSGIPFINVLEVITKAHLRRSDIPGRISLPNSLVDSYSVRHGDILFNRTSETQEELGLSSVYLDDDTVVFGGFVIRGRPKIETLDATYSGYAFRTANVRAQIIAKGQGAIRANIGQAELRRVLAPYPPPSEQRVIADVLAHADELINALDELIAKKRTIHQAVTQRLLAGTLRLPGLEIVRGDKDTEIGPIPKDWEIRSLLEVVSLPRGQVDPRRASYSSMILVAPDYIQSGTGRLLKKRSASDQVAISGKFRFSPGDVIYSKIRPYLRKAVLADFEGLCSADMYPLTPGRGVSPSFMLAVLLGDRFSRFAETVSMRSGIPKINRKELAEFRLALPPSLEQRAIAAVLSDMDAEIAALERRRAKIQAIKQGMMHVLLTGRVRLVPPASEPPAATP